MVDFFDKLNNRIINRNKFLVKIKYYAALRFILKSVVNFIVPIYYAITIDSSQLKFNLSKRTGPKKIVSLTTFPVRIGKIWIVIESILRQKHKPDMIILWLSKEQFSTIDKLPKKLKTQQKKGLDIRFCDGDLKSHKKYFYTLKEFPDDFLITVDDDIIYPTTMLGDLIELNRKYPTSICCHRALNIETLNHKILPYKQWIAVKGETEPSFCIFLTSGGGTLFPPYSLHNEVFNDNVFRRFCFYADDVWLNIMSRLNETTIVKSKYDSALLLLDIPNNVHLYSTNIISGDNDNQIEAIRNYYNNKNGIDPLSKCLN